MFGASGVFIALQLWLFISSGFVNADLATMTTLICAYSIYLVWCNVDKFEVKESKNGSRSTGS